MAHFLGSFSRRGEGLYGWLGHGLALVTAGLPPKHFSERRRQWAGRHQVWPLCTLPTPGHPCSSDSSALPSSVPSPQPSPRIPPPAVLWEMLLPTVLLFLWICHQQHIVHSWSAKSPAGRPGSSRSACGRTTSVSTAVQWGYNQTQPAWWL